MEKVELILKCNNIFDSVGDKTFPGAVAVGNGLIIDVKNSIEALAPFIEKDTKIIDLGARLLLPGFHDNHIHLYISMIFSDAVFLGSAVSEFEAAQAVKEYADKHPEKEWIIGYGWHHAKWGNVLPLKESLDELLPDQPVFLMNESGHGAWVNSKAIDEAGISAESEDPPFGRIGRHKNSEPTGYLYERAMALVGDIALKLTADEENERFREFLRLAAENGITSVDDMIPITGLNLGDPKFYAGFERNSELTVRINFHTALQKDLAEAERLRQEYNSDKLTFAGLKEFIDGVASTHTACMIEPYHDDPSTRGVTLLPKEYLRACVNKADKAGFRIRLHAVGDGAVRLALDCYEEAGRKNGKRDSRHTIEHVEIIHPDDIKRFGKLNVIPSLQPLHMNITDKLEAHPFFKVLGKEREKYYWVDQSFFSLGAEPSYGTDYPIAPINPLVNIYRAVTRKFDKGGLPEGWNPQERVSVTDALKSYTAVPAYAVFKEDKLGTIEAEKLADMTVIDRNIIDLPADEIIKAEISMTIMDGKIVYRKKEE